MMDALMVRAEAIGRAAQRRRLQEIAGGLREHGIKAEVATDSVSIRGRNVIRRWLQDPMLRFLGKSGA